MSNHRNGVMTIKNVPSMEEEAGETSTDFIPFPWDYELFSFDNSSNVTNISTSTDTEIHFDFWKKIPIGIVLSLLCLLTIIGNGMVLYAVRTERRLQTVSNMYIVSLAIADLIVGVFVMPVSTVYIFTEDWLFGIAVCQLWIAVDYTASTASILNLFILSVDRYWSVTSPLKYLRKRTKRRALHMISFVWCMSCLWIVPIVGWHEFAHGGVRTVPTNICDTEYAKDSVFKVITAFFNFYLPLAIMYSLYGKVFHEIRKRSALELGQSFPRPVTTMKYAPDGDPPTMEDSSEQRVDTFTCTDDNSFRMDTDHYYSTTKHSPSTNIKHADKHSINKKRTNYLTLKSLRPKVGTNTIVKNYHPNKCKVEYIYDENVIDPKTEKVERFYYQEHIPMSVIRAKDILIKSQVNTESSLTPPSTPVSSSSDERKSVNRDRNPKQTYSLVSGIRQLRQAKQILNHTVSVSGVVNSNQNNGRSRGVLFFGDEASRRLSTMFNIKHRLKNIRQSSSLTREIKAARQLGVIMGAFTLCFLPYFILFLVVAFCNGCVEGTLITAMTWIGYLNSTLNPFLYPLCNANFRRKFKSILHLDRKRRIRRSRDTMERTSFTMRYD